MMTEIWPVAGPAVPAEIRNEPRGERIGEEIAKLLQKGYNLTLGGVQSASVFENTAEDNSTLFDATRCLS